MPFNLTRYRPSGRFRPIALVYAARTVLLGTLAGFVYQLGHHYLPLPYDFFMVGVLAFFALSPISRVVREGHVRNRHLTLGTALATALGALLASYACEYLFTVWDILSERSDLTFWDVLKGVSVTRWLQMRAEGGWVISGHNDSSHYRGGFVYAAWAAEALVLFGAALLAWGSENDLYCEACEQWMTWKDPLRVKGIGRETVEPLLLAGDLQRLLSLQSPPDAENMPCVLLGGVACPSCQDIALSVQTGQRKTKRDGSTKIVLETLVQHVHLTPPQLQRMRERLQERAQAREATAAATQSEPVVDPPASPA